MKKTIPTPHWYRIMLVTLGMLLLSNTYAHDASSLNDDAIDRMNDTIVNNVLQTQGVLSGIFQRQRADAAWPDPEIDRLQSELMHLKEESELTLEYLLASGANLQSAESLMANPRAGRSVSADQAIDTAIALLKHASTLENLDAFVKEIYTGGQSAYMYNLLTAYREKMALYAELMKLKTGE